MPTTILRILIGVALACLIAGLVRAFVDADGANSVVTLDAVWQHALTAARWSFPFVALAVVLTEWLRLRHVAAYLAGGIAVALASAWLSAGPGGPPLQALSKLPSGTLLAVMGAVAGLTYWLVRGSRAGWLGDAAEAEAVAIRNSVADRVRDIAPKRCWPCLLAGLCLAALPVLALGYWWFYAPRLDASIRAKTETEAKSTLASAGYPWASLRIDDSVGRIVGSAPNEDARNKAFATATTLLAPVIGVPGVIAELRNDLTAPRQPTAAEIAAEARAKAEEEQRRQAAAAEAQRRAAAEAEAKRRAEEEQRRLAAAAEAKRKAEEEQRRIAAEAEAKRKAEEERLRAAAAAAAAAAASAAEAKKKAGDEQRQIAVAPGCTADTIAEIESARILFDTAASTLGVPDLALIERLLPLLSACGSAKIRINGHTDAIGSVEYNDALAARRAETVRALLVGRGVAGERILIETFGARQPLASNETEAGRALNRRADISVLMDLDQRDPAHQARVTSCAADIAAILRQAGQINFEVNSAEIAASSRPALDAIAEKAKTCIAFGLLVEGHTDKTGDAEANQQLSEQRARAVRDALVVRGVTAGRILTKGFGASKPLDPSDTREAHARNRRIEISVGVPVSASRN